MAEKVVCRECRKEADIICWPADAPEKAICPDCCAKSEDGHKFEYVRGERRHECKYCGVPASDEWYADRMAD